MFLGALNSERERSARGKFATLAEKPRKRLKSCKGWFACDAAYNAAYTALSAAIADWEPALAVRAAEQALSTHPTCPHAHYLLARYQAASPQQALERFERGCEGYEQLLSEEGRRRVQRLHGARPGDAHVHAGALACMAGAVTALCRLGRHAEAHQRLQALLRLSSPPRDVTMAEGDALAAGWAIAPEVVFRARGPVACLEWLEEHGSEEAFGAADCGLWWSAMWALAWVATRGKDEGFVWTSLEQQVHEGQLRRAVGPYSPGCSPCSVAGVEPSRVPGGAGGAAAPFLPRGSPARGMREKLRGGMALGLLCSWLPYLVDMLLGDMPVPPGPLPGWVLPGCVGLQVAYARQCGDLWRDTPGLLDFVRRYRNTYEVACIVTDARCDRPIHIDAFRRYMAPLPPPGPRPAAAATTTTSNTSTASAPGRSPSSPAAPSPPISPDAVRWEGCCSWMGLVDLLLSFNTAVARRPDPTLTAEELEMLQTLLAAGCPLDVPSRRAPGWPGPSVAPLGCAMHRGCGPQAVTALLKAGGDPLLSQPPTFIPVVVAAEQGRWRELQALFKLRKRLGPGPNPFLLSAANPSVTCLFEVLLIKVFRSDCAPCVQPCAAGGSRARTCWACEDGHEGDPHGPWCNFHKVLEVLVAYGMKSVSAPVMAWVRRTVSESPPRDQPAHQALLATLERLLAGRSGGEQRAPAKPAEAKHAGPADTPVAVAALPPQPRLAAVPPAPPNQAQAGTPSTQGAVQPTMAAREERGARQAQPQTGAGPLMPIAVLSRSPAPAQAQEPSAAALEPLQDDFHCWACGKAKDRSAGVKLSKCGRCMMARYCCTDCSHTHWPAHKAQCKLLRSKR